MGAGSDNDRGQSDLKRYRAFCLFRREHCLFRAGSRGGRRDGASVAWLPLTAGLHRALNGDLALPVSRHGERIETARPTARRPRHGSRGSRSGGATPPDASAHCRGQIVWRPHDITGTGRGSLPNVAGLVFIGSPASRGEAVGRSRQALGGGAYPDALFARNQ